MNRRERTFSRRAGLDGFDLRLCRVLSEASKEFTELLAGDGALSLLVGEGEGFLVFWRGKGEETRDVVS